MEIYYADVTKFCLFPNNYTDYIDELLLPISIELKYELRYIALFTPVALVVFKEDIGVIT